MSALATTLDAAHDGRVMLEQPAAGYRFTLDSLLLAARVAHERPASVLDIGAGVGVIGLCVQDRSPATRATFVEREPSMASCLRRNLERATGEAERVAVECDARHWSSTERFAAVVMNPPYYRPGEGRLNPNPVRAAARHMLHGTVEELIATAARHVADDGALHLVFPASGALRLCGACGDAALPRVSMRFVHPAVGRDANAVLVRAARGNARTLRVESPLVCYGPAGSRTPEVEDAWNGR